MKFALILLLLLLTAGCVGGPGYPERRTPEPSPPQVTETPTQAPTETPFPTVKPELPRRTPAPTTPPPTLPLTEAPKPTTPPPPTQQPLTLLWNYETGFDVYGVGITDDGSMIVGGSGDFYLYAFNRTGGILWKYKTHGAVNDVSITPKGDRIAATSFVTPDSAIYLLDSRGNLLWKKSLENLSKGVDLAYDGSAVAVGLANNKIKVLDRNGALLWGYETRSSPWGVWDVALKRDGGLVAGSDDTYFYVLSPKGELLFNDSKGTGKYIHSVAVSNEGDYIGVVSHDKGIYLYKGTKLLWRYETGRLNYGVALTAKGDLVAAGSWDKNLYLLNTEGKLIMKYPMNSYVNRVAFSGDGKYLATGTVDGGIYLFEVKP